VPEAMRCSLWLRKSPIPLAGLALLVAIGAGYVVPRAYLDDKPIVFYAAALIVAASIAVCVHTSGRLSRSATLRTISLTLLLFAAVLPIADLFVRRQDAAVSEPVRPVYSFRAAKGDPRAFEAWWQSYATEWYRDGQPNTEAPDPQRVLPFVLVPNSTARFFASDFRINNLGFRGRDFEPRKNGQYRIFALGESATFGPTLHRDDRPWPELLQDLIDHRLTCRRSVQVINAGIDAYNLHHNLERLRRDILPLEPDLVLSYHSVNILPLLDERLGTLQAVAPPARVPRASALLGAVEFGFRWREFIKARQRLEAFAPSDEEMRASKLAASYDELIRLGREHNFVVALANASLAVTPDSPDEVIDFYDRVFANTRRMLAATAAHNRLLERIAGDTGTLLIDTTPGFAGEWDADLFLDLVHFTPRGMDRFAQRIFDGLKPLLAADAALRCIESVRKSQ
jgi:lysophospholipase L1-like esterase